LNGYIDLLIPASGQAGKGLGTGQIAVKVKRPNSSKSFYQGKYRTAHEVSDVNCMTDGSLQFTTTAFALEKTMDTTGTPPVELEQWDFQPEPWSAHWALSPSVEARHMTGSVRSEGNIVTQGTVSIRRDS
jgi:hypothetical protein